MLEIIFILLQLLFGIMFFFLTIAFITGAPFVPSQKKTAKKMVELAKISKNDTVYDLGSGDGRLILEAAQQTTKAVYGIEINPVLVWFTKLRILLSGQKNSRCRWGNFWTTDLSDANIVFVYLLPWKMEALAKKLKHELKPGSRVVSNSFIFPNWKMISNDESLHVYVFEV
jgi:16S rRNA A1518/A1519 N6-dimethyltransferase RsmA/KsgA/DIM1 with predicted DNA glycosylase/AP lyase activity